MSKQRYVTTIEQAIAIGLWPAEKEITTQQGYPELDALGYKLFYIGKNADLYFKYDEVNQRPTVLMVRSDRTSVFDIPTDLIIPGKGVIQNGISNLGYDFAEKRGLLTSRLPLPNDIPEHIAQRSQLQELNQSLIATLTERQSGVELIFRNYITGSLWEHYQNGRDPYHLCLPKGMEEWDKFSKAVFTPTTKAKKGEKDTPLNSDLIHCNFSRLVAQLETLFKDFTSYALERGIVVVDTKFEVGVSCTNHTVLIDEVLTPESSRFILLENFSNGEYISMDKQIIRNYAEAQGWKEQAKGLKKGEILQVDVPDEIKKQVLDGYRAVYALLVA